MKIILIIIITWHYYSACMNGWMNVGECKCGRTGVFVGVCLIEMGNRPVALDPAPRPVYCPLIVNGTIENLDKIQNGKGKNKLTD